MTSCYAGLGTDGRVVNVTVPTVAGGRRTVFGLYAALSLDEGASWPHYKLVSGAKAAAAPIATNDSDNQPFMRSAT